MLGDATSVDALSEHFGYNLTETEVRWLMGREYAQTAEDVLWRRSKLGLRLTTEEAARLDTWMTTALQT
jgi:glycerol-3-phosphate dehydrogenase